MNKLTSLLLCALLVFTGCECKKQNQKAMSNISQETIVALQDALVQQHPALDAEQVKKGIAQSAALWREEDGTQEEFKAFVENHLAATPDARRVLFDKLSTAYEVLLGTANQVAVRLQKPVTLTGDELTEVDYIFGAYFPFDHMSDDLFANKIAFITILNFPNYTLAEKDELGKNWTREQWAYSRMGDRFTARIPASVNQQVNQSNSNSENYIAAYNIQMGHLIDENGEKIFPEDMSLLSHWNLRDELKSNYADVPNASRKQEMIYKVMEHIVLQTIPAEVINDPTYDWNPYTNKVYCDGQEVASHAEGTVRYERLLDAFHAQQMVDPYYPALPTALERNFEGTMEVSQAEIQKLFETLISSEQVARTAQIIRQRLGRELRPYDIWYDGFKSRSTISEDELTAKTRDRYPDAMAFEKDMPRMLRALGFDRKDAEYISSKIVVEGARGSGHAWGAQGKWEPARLRTRIGAEGMDYKGYNIAVHEFGHNVEQTLDLYDIDYYMLNGVPNTGFTEALAFMFQKRDLQLLGYNHKADDNATLDIFWGAYEIMGVALVDMFTWQWLYANPDATAAQLRDATVSIARDVWNKYYEPILGTHDSPLLAVYSHMINAPLYLANYPFGNIIEFQLEDYLAGCKNDKEFAKELRRIYTIGRLTPNAWMNEAIGSDVSVEPLLQAVDAILNKTK